jgi:hypothetical protein
MRVIEGERFDCRAGGYTLPSALEDVEFRRCTVSTCQHAPAQDGPDDRPLIRGVRLVRCHIEGSDLPPVVVEDSVVDTIWFSRGIWGPQRLRGCAFRHVVIRGPVTGGLAFGPSPAVYLRASADMADDPYVLANAAYYRDVDWALDIREAEFTGVEFHAGIPAGLIRRDPATQVVLRRAALLAGDWDERVDDSLARIWIDGLLASGFADTVLVAGRRSKRFARDLAAIEQLVDLGFAER